jgi:hypothetical protein
MDEARLVDYCNTCTVLSEVRSGKEVGMKVGDIKHILQDSLKEFVVGTHSDLYAADATCMDCTVITKRDSNGSRERGEM